MNRTPKTEEAPALRRAFVFGGGGVLGFSWIVGALTAMQHELSMQVRTEDLCIGTSAGAVAAALLSCGVDVDSIRRHQLGMPLPKDPPISWQYETDTGGARPPRPGLRPGSVRLVWGGIRHHSAVPASVALSGLLPRGRGNLDPIHRMIDTVVAENLPDSDWPRRKTWIVATDYSNGRRVVFGREGSPRAGIADAVCASCSIPAWYQPVEIGGTAYIDGGTVSNASTDLLSSADFDEVYVLAPMAALVSDNPRSPVAMIERRVRRGITRAIMNDVEKMRSAGVKVMVLTPGPDDLEAMGGNLMNPRRRTAVLHTALRTVASEIRAQQREGTKSKADSQAWQAQAIAEDLSTGTE